MRLYRAAWLAVLIPLLLVAFTVTRPAPLPRSAALLEPTFDAVEAARRARELAALYPDRSPGSPSSLPATQWMRRQFESLGLRTEVDRFTAKIPGRGKTDLRNVSAIVPGRSLDTILVIAHRDSTAGRLGLNDNASGTGALLELARSVGASRPETATGRSPNHTLRFVSTDGGAYGLLGARRLAAAAGSGRIVAVLALDAVGSPGSPRIAVAGRGPRSPDPVLLSTVTARLEEQAGPRPQTPAILGQLVDLAFPFSLNEQLEMLASDRPSVALTTEGGGPGQIDMSRMAQIGRATETTLASLDLRLAPPNSTGPYVATRSRHIQGWAIVLVYVAMLVPFGLALLDLVARLHRWRIPLRPAFRSYARRLAFWLWAGLLFWLFGLAGAWPDGEAAVLNPDSQAAGHWPRLGLALYTLAVAASWLVARGRLVRRGPVAGEEAVAGLVTALIAIGLVALVTIATNPYALLLLLPSAHVWLLAAQWRGSRAWVRAALFVAGLTGGLLLLSSFAIRFGLGLDAPWYLAELAAIGYVPTVGIVLTLVWAAAAAQVAAVLAERYAPYPAPSDRPARGLVGRAVASTRNRSSRRERTAA